jgi:thymidylate synthase
VIRRSHNKPDWRESKKLFINFLEGMPVSQLKDSKNKKIKNSHFTQRFRPQGEIQLLHRIYELLYSGIEKEKALKQEKINQINDILKDVTSNTKFDILYDSISDHCKKFPILSEPPKN